jgi:iron complex outermembrane receptor protein
VINVITKRPNFDRVSVEGNVGGNYNAYNADAAFNLPVNDWAAFRLSLNYDTRDNFVKGVANDPITTRVPHQYLGPPARPPSWATGRPAAARQLFALTGSRDSSVPFSNFYQLSDNPNGGRTAPAPIGDTRQSLTTPLLSANFNTPFTTMRRHDLPSLTTHQYGGETNPLQAQRARRGL